MKAAKKMAVTASTGQATTIRIPWTLVKAARTAFTVRGTHPENTVGFTATVMGGLFSCLVSVPVSVVLPKRKKNRARYM